MKLQFLGTGAAEGIPALFCGCDYCKAVKNRGGKEVRTRSQVLIDGTLSIDFPPDAFTHAVNGKLDFSAIEHLLVTHSHMDHFYAHDFVLRGYKYANNLAAPTLNIYGNEEVKEVFEECTRRELRQDVACNLSVHTVSAFTPFQAGKYTVTPLPATHTSQSPYVYLVEGEKRYLHLTDTGLLKEETYEYLTGKHADCITFDCTFLFKASQEVRRHMGVEDIALTAERLTKLGVNGSNTKRILTHFSHHSNPTEESLKRAEEQLKATAAYDGMTVEL